MNIRNNLALIMVIAFLLGIMIGAFIHNHINKKNISRINVNIEGNVGDKSLRRRIDSTLTGVVEFHEFLQKEVQEILKDNNNNIHLKNEDRIFLETYLDTYKEQYNNVQKKNETLLLPANTNSGELYEFYIEVLNLRVEQSKFNSRMTLVNIRELQQALDELILN